MRAYFLALTLLGVVAFSLATALEPSFQGWAGSRAQSSSVVQVALGDGRKLFASHVFLKADAYFHNGYYPTIYDNKEGFETGHLAGQKHEPGEAKEANFLGESRDWIDAFSRNFFPARHTHLGDAECDDEHCQHPGHTHEGEKPEHEDEHEHGHEQSGDPKRRPGGAGKKEGDQREILPWLRLSAELDPERVETYVVSAYWLRTSLNKVDDAEQFLREGLRANPCHYEILFELGCVYNESRNDPGRARNLWELGLKDWRERQAAKKDPGTFIYARTLGNLASLEEKQKNYARALELLATLKTISPNQEGIQRWMADLEAKQAEPSSGKTG